MSLRLFALWLLCLIVVVACSSDSGSDSVTAAMDNAHARLNEGDPQAAIAEFDRAIELDPDLAVAYQGRAVAYMQRSEVGRITDYDDPNANSSVGDQSDLDLAVADLNRAIELDPEDPISFFNRCLVYSFKNEPDQAIADCNQSIVLDPNDHDAYRLRGNAYLEKGDLDQAIADFDRTIELDSSNPNVFNGRAMAYRLKGDLERAVADLERVVELTPEDAQAYLNRGVLRAELGQADQAIADFREVLRLSNDSSQVQYAEEQLSLLGAGQ